MGSIGLLLNRVPPGELPPPPPGPCFGREELIEKIIGLAENLTSIALIGAGGIGKTSIALTVLHHDRIRQRFGHDCRFIRCDQFVPSCAHFLSRLSKVIGAGVINPEDLAPLRPFISSRDMIIILDNAESILDPNGPGAQDVYAVVEELSQYNNICLCITTRIATIPPHCKILEIPTLSMEAACNTFYSIYENDERSHLVDTILEQLAFHPLSVTLLATVAHQNRWNNNQLTREWERQRTGMLQTQHNRSLAAAIELSLASPMFRELGPDARGLLGVVAFFPQGVNENNIDWLFPTKNIFSRFFPARPKRRDIFDKFCVLSLTYRSNGFITMLAPLRDHLRPDDPASSSLLRITKKCYFNRLSVHTGPGDPGFEDASWITSEDVNVEHLLDVFTTINANSKDVWDVCGYFMEHLIWHKTRLVILGPKIEGLPDNHRSKPKCLLQLSRLFKSVGNQVEHKRLLVYTLKLWRERGDDRWIADTLRFLSDANRMLGLYKEGIEQAREALDIFKRLNDELAQARAWHRLARLLHSDGQFDAAEEAAFRAISLFSDKGNQFEVCRSHRLLGDIYSSKGETGEAIDHYKTAIRIASPFNWRNEQFWIHHSMAELFYDNRRFDDARTHAKHAKSHAVNDPYCLGRAMELQARILYKSCKFEEAKTEALRAADTYKKIGAMKDVEDCRAILRDIETGAGGLAISSEPDFNFNGELLETVPPPAPINAPLSDPSSPPGIVSDVNV